MDSLVWKSPDPKGSQAQLLVQPGTKSSTQFLLVTPTGFFSGSFAWRIIGITSAAADEHRMDQA